MFQRGVKVLSFLCMTVHTASISIVYATRYPCRSHSPVVKSACARYRPLFSLDLYIPICKHFSSISTHSVIARSSTSSIRASLPRVFAPISIAPVLSFIPPFLACQSWVVIHMWVEVSFSIIFQLHSRNSLVHFTTLLKVD